MRKIDLTGLIYGRLTVLRDSGERKSSIPMWECKCECGTYVKVHGSSLRGRKTLSCGCYQREQAKKNKNDLVGCKFGRLTVLRDSGSRKEEQVCWECSCECGKLVTVRAYSLKSGDTTSCGCFHIEQVIAKKTTHGMSSSRIYSIWVNMINRCYRPNTVNYDNYGGRGITVCDAWNTFDGFYADMGDPPSAHSLDRIDSNGNYTKENCRWATNLQQANNARTNRVLTFNGMSKTMSEWERYLGFSTGLVRHRLNRGWNVEKSLTTPLLGK